jgi:hypothetical protein
MRIFVPRPLTNYAKVEKVTYVTTLTGGRSNQKPIQGCTNTFNAHVLRNKVAF